MLVGCSDPKFDEASQTGLNPLLPDPKQFLIPPINVAPGEGWPAGKTPVVAAGLQIKALVQGLHHPRFVYVLPNGDILAVQAKSPPPEPVKRPKDPIVAYVKNKATSFPTGPKAESRITLIRDADGDGTPELTTVLLDHLNSPFGVVYYDGTLYVANTDFGRLPVHAWSDQARPTGAAGDLAARRPDRPPLDEEPDHQSGWDEVVRNRRIEQQHRRNGWDAERDRACVWEIDRATARTGFSPVACAIPTAPTSIPAPTTCSWS